MCHVPVTAMWYTCIKMSSGTAIRNPSLHVQPISSNIFTKSRRTCRNRVATYFMIISTVKLLGSRGINPILIIEFNRLIINCFYSFRSQTHIQVTDRWINIPIPHFIRFVPIILSNDILWLVACFCHTKISNFCLDRFLIFTVRT